MATKAQLEAANAALLSRLAAIEASLAEAATIPQITTYLKEHAITTTEIDKLATAVETPADKADRTIASTRTVKIVKVAVHGKGMQIEGQDAWLNVVKGGKPILLPLKTGQTVVLNMSAAGRIVSYMAPKGAVKASTTTTAEAKRPACPQCGGAAHNNYTRDQVAAECAERQYTRETGNIPSLTAPDSLTAFAAWLAAAPRTVFAHDKTGSFVIGKPTAVATEAAKDTADAQLAATLRKNRARHEAATAAGPAKTTPAAAVKAQQTASAATVETTTAPGEYVEGETYTGYVNKLATNTPGLLRFVCATVPGKDGNGKWIGAETGSKLASSLAKLSVGDRIKITVGMVSNRSGVKVLGIVKASRLDKIEEVTGVTKGIETSGKQKPAAPRTQPKDGVVKKGQMARAAARAAARRAAQDERNVAAAAALNRGETISA